MIPLPFYFRQCPGSTWHSWDFRWCSGSSGCPRSSRACWAIRRRRSSWRHRLAWKQWSLLSSCWSPWQQWYSNCVARDIYIYIYHHYTHSYALELTIKLSLPCTGPTGSMGGASAVPGPPGPPGATGAPGLPSTLAGPVRRLALSNIIWMYPLDFLIPLHLLLDFSCSLYFHFFLLRASSLCSRVRNYPNLL